MGQTEISTKANTLYAIRDLLTKSYVEDLMIITVREFVEDSTDVFSRVFQKFNGEKIVVRSSSTNEDSMTASNAGCFESVLNVHSDDMEEVEAAIVKVADSYMDVFDDAEYIEKGTFKEEILDEQVLLQKQAKNIVLSGVIFTRDIINNLPYYVVTYDDNGSTDSVTSGAGGKTTWIAKNASREFLGDCFVNLLGAVKEIEKIFDDIEALDIEFGIDINDKINIFQVRPLAAVIGKNSPISEQDFKEAKAFAKCNYLDTNHIISDMAYWNPAEIIGTNPRPLDYSLYREIITSYVWTEGIHKLGYQLVDGELMQKVGNKPYISVNYTFDGLTPAGLPPQLCYKLNTYYEKMLKKDKTAHDKIEFEIIFNSYDFSTRDRLQNLLEYGFDEKEINTIADSLFHLTKNIINDYDEMCKKDLEALNRLTQLRHSIREESPLSENNIMKLYKYVKQLLDSIRTDGTPQFTRHARCAFIARSLCRTLVEKGYFTDEEMDAFMLSISTVASEFERDFDKYSCGEMSREEFNRLYGHLRLGTYDIRTDCYRNIYFHAENSRITRGERKTREYKMLDCDKLDKAIKDIGFDISAEQMIKFITEATKNREYFKFEFTKSLSLVLDLIIKIGDILGIAREDMSYLEVQDLLSYHSRDSYIEIIEERRHMYHAYSFLTLPDVIFCVGDIDVIDIDDARPNFITNKAIEADVVNLDGNDTTDIEGKIVVLTKADPGYDWIFAKRIAGFVTKYGGAASHMAIRCAEFGIPAAIGCGEKIYQRVCMMDRMLLDCENEKITKK